MKCFLLFLFPRAQRDYDGQTQNQTLPFFPIVLTFAHLQFFLASVVKDQRSKPSRTLS